MKNKTGSNGDDEGGESTLSSKERLLLVTQELMWDQDLTPGEIFRVVEKFYGREKARGSSFYILRSGFHCSFLSEVPFVTASIYYRNMCRIYPQFEVELWVTAAKMFKNMVMEGGSTGVVIRSEPEYCAVQQEYFDAFRICPPKRVNVFAALIQDRSCMRKILAHPEYFQRIVDIFSYVEPRGVAMLRAELLAAYQQELERHTETGGLPGEETGITDRMSIIHETRYLSTYHDPREDADRMVPYSPL